MTDTKHPFDYKTFLATLTGMPGVYRMLNEKGDVIYVGKAKNLKKRVSSYFARSDQTTKTQVMVTQIRAIETTVTHTENEALILEANLIKSLKPFYNITYRDDKSYPYIYLSSQQTYPRLSYYRGARREEGQFFGPYPNSSSARESLNLLQKIFPVRQCEDSFFKNRSRPCLQYQIKRCSAPCVELISEKDYAEQVRHAIMFLSGKNNDVLNELADQMQHASDQMDYEKAAVFRDQIAALRKVQERQYVSGDQQNNLDVIAVVNQGEVVCVQLFMIRGGHNLGNKVFYPKAGNAETSHELLSAFIAQHYLGKNNSQMLPDELLVNIEPDDKDWLCSVLTEQAGRKIAISDKLRGERARWIAMAQNNANIALQIHLQGKATLLARFEALQDALNLDEPPMRLECFDISHTMGEETVASCVVFDQSGAVKSDYRRFNIKDITPGDDYAAMYQALTRRYKKIKQGEGKLPDILLIDGGKGQLKQAENVLRELQVEGVLMVGVAKGPDRKPGMETLFLSGQPQAFILPASSPALHLIQQVRDEAHRFAITGHRTRRGKKRETSTLEEIPGLGPKRRQELLRQFGGLQGISRAGVEDIARTKGISKELAQKIYDYFHAE
ncbi:MAG: excinuclease ABC subunit UvrC [Gammaproteobacteria bacterium]|nr:excinuclease ABC subunit UvrC [Gammaproteobacteria bacterium]MDH5727925.1 excinuclease ABC subunit UvrC [Gammaproteobacteria bacterium]